MGLARVAQVAGHIPSRRSTSSTTVTIKAHAANAKISNCIPMPPDILSFTVPGGG
jgi:hypothetical protein